jgi:hypothetical protein
MTKKRIALAAAEERRLFAPPEDVAKCIRVLTLMCGHASIEPNVNEMSDSEAITLGRSLEKLRIYSGRSLKIYARDFAPRFLQTLILVRHHVDV